MEESTLIRHANRRRARSPEQKQRAASNASTNVLCAVIMIMALASIFLLLGA